LAWRMVSKMKPNSGYQSWNFSFVADTEEISRPMQSRPRILFVVGAILLLVWALLAREVWRDFSVATRAYEAVGAFERRFQRSIRSNYVQRG
jgi:hypothetical protein